jgi:hypothetical protein
MLSRRYVFPTDLHRKRIDRHIKYCLSWHNEDAYLSSSSFPFEPIFLERNDLLLPQAEVSAKTTGVDNYRTFLCITTPAL